MFYFLIILIDENEVHAQCKPRKEKGMFGSFHRCQFCFFQRGLPVRRVKRSGHSEEGIYKLLQIRNSKAITFKTVDAQHHQGHETVRNILLSCPHIFPSAREATISRFVWVILQLPPNQNEDLGF